MKQTSSDTTTHLPHDHQVLGVPALHTHPTGVARRGRGWGTTDSIRLMAACTHSDAVACTHMECIAGPWRQGDLSLELSKGSRACLMVLAWLVKRRVVVDNVL